MNAPTHTAVGERPDIFVRTAVLPYRGYEYEHCHTTCVIKNGNKIINL